MEKRSRRKFIVEYKQDVIRMLEEKEIPIMKLGKDMGLGIDLLYSWRRRYGKSNYDKDHKHEFDSFINEKFQCS